MAFLVRGSGYRTQLPCMINDAVQTKF